MADPASSFAPQPAGATGVLVLADGAVLWGHGFGAEGAAVGEVCFNTAMTGYQEVMTDPSYAAQIVTFTFPHIGNVGVNEEDLEAHVDGAAGCVVREAVTPASNFRSSGEFGDWLKGKGKIGLSGIDTRALTRRIRMTGAPNAVIAHSAEGKFDIPALVKRAQDWPGLEGMDLARVVSRPELEKWEGGVWTLGKGYARSPHAPRPHVVAIDFGAKDNIFRSLVKAGAQVTVVPAQTSLDEVLALNPAGVFLSNGPGDPAATGAYAVPVIQGLLERDVPVFGICLGHQMLALAAGARTTKMHQGHRGANHPVKRLADGVVEITAMNHGFAVDGASLPEGVEETHVSLFDGSNCGISVKGKRAFGVQYHPEASPGPMDSFYLFERFVGMLGNELNAIEIADGPLATISRPKKVVVALGRKPLGLQRKSLPSARPMWLGKGMDIPRELASRLVKSCAWWNTHSSGSPVRAPGHSKNIKGISPNWYLEFGANSLLIGAAIQRTRPMLNGALDQLKVFARPDVSKLRKELELAFRKSIANVNGDRYHIYPIEGREMIFGAQSIHIDNAIDFLLKETGILSKLVLVK